MKPILAIILATCAILCLTVDASPRPLHAPTVQPADLQLVGCPCGADCQCEFYQTRAKDIAARCDQLLAENQKLFAELQAAKAKPVKLASVATVKQASPCPGGVCAVPRQVAVTSRRVVVSKPQAVRRGLLGRWKQ